MTTRMLRPTMYLSAAALPLLAGCQDKTDAAAEVRTPAVPVTIATVGSGTRVAPVTATGTFGSRDEIPLAFKIGGVVQRVLVDAGQTVHRGQILAALDVREIDAAVAKARVGVDKAQRDWARVQRLVTDSVATPVQLLDATSALEAAKADLASAMVNREYATITAPEDGVVLQRLINPGSNVASGTPIVLLGGSTRGRVLRVALPDRDALKVAVGNEATVHFDALPDKQFSGRVVLVSQSADPRTGTYGVEVALTQADQLPSGLIGVATIAVKGASTGNRLPVDALLDAHGDSATVYTIAPTGAPIAQRARVRVAQLMGDEAVIEGLAADTRVIAKGAAYVTSGTPVRVITPTVLDSALARTGGLPK
ncbi:MAG: efflux RND transporter periplasmic adaptor subunit [Gemmatimonadaceae bacterium]|nr:efflux RND transporter periplasmic adaptor subunit [Gemmatimonadaceae bacterium]